MNEELKLHIKKLQRRATLSLIAILSTIISIGFGILFLFVSSFVAILFFVIVAICIVYLIHSSHTSKKETKENEKVRPAKPIGVLALTNNICHRLFGNASELFF